MDGSDRRSLDGQVAVITGGVRRIGRAIALALAAEGAAIVINTKSSRTEGEALVQELEAAGARALLHLADITDEAAVAQMVERVTQLFGRVDILVNNAANRKEAPFTSITLARWREILSIVLDGAFLCSRAVVPFMVEQGGGRIINIGGVTAHTGAYHRAHVVTAKAGVVGLTKALAVEFADKGITVNCVVPGKIGGARSATSGETGGSMPGGGNPLVGRTGKPEEVAEVVRMLCLPSGGFITGQTIHVSGGLYLP
jgi:3-oxoacyl-[acyl-carrier protein] reductase